MVDAPSAFNVILGRPAINTFQAAISTYYQKMKFLMGDQVGEVAGDERSARNYYIEMVRVDQKKARRYSARSRCREEVQMLEEGFMMRAVEHGLEDVHIVPGCPEKVTKITLDLSVEWRGRLVSCLTGNHDIFPWSVREV